MNERSVNTPLTTGRRAPHCLGAACCDASAAAATPPARRLQLWPAARQGPLQTPPPIPSRPLRKPWRTQPASACVVYVVVQCVWMVWVRGRWGAGRDRGNQQPTNLCRSCILPKQPPRAVIASGTETALWHTWLAALGGIDEGKLTTSKPAIIPTLFSFFIHMVLYMEHLLHPPVPTSRCAARQN
jgi:hypothetical protein